MNIDRHRTLNPSMKSVRIKPRPPKVSEVPEEQRASVWSYPAKWLKEESFYRDITTRALSIAVVALVAYIYAVATGYLQTPSGSGLVVILALTFMVVLSGFVVRARFREGGPVSPALTGLYVAGATLFVVLIVWLVPRTSNTSWEKAITWWTWGATAVLGVMVVAIYGSVFRQRLAVKRSRMSTKS